MAYTRGIYRGVRKRLRDQTALITKVPGGYRAQFDSLHHREAFGWWFFPTKDFEEVNHEQAES